MIRLVENTEVDDRLEAVVTTNSFTILNAMDIMVRTIQYAETTTKKLIRLDLRNIDYMDSTAISVLVGTKKNLEKHGILLEVQINTMIDGLIRKTGLYGFIKFIDSEGNQYV